jgi:2-haloacid dehalogenase
MRLSPTFVKGVIKSMALRYLFFDLDGTLMDFDQSEAAAFAGAFAGEGFYTDDETLTTYRQISRKLWNALELGQITKEHLVVERFKQLFEHYDWDLDPVRMNDIYVSTLGVTGILYPNTLSLLEQLEGKVPMALVTNGVSKAQRGRLAGSGIEKFFTHLFISEEVGAEKPSPAFFTAALSACGIENPAEVLIVGDSLSADMRGGVNSGLKTCWFNPTGQQNSLNLPLDYQITSLDEVPAIVEKELEL